VETIAREEFGITEWQLSNGVHVVLKPTTLKEDEILVRAFSPGGTSLVPDEDYIPARTAANVVSEGGLGEFSAIDLRKMLAGKVASVSPYIGDEDEGLSGSASARDFETLFQLIYLTFTAPRQDAERFQVIQDEMRANLANQEARPGFAFQQAMTSLLSQDHPRARLMTVDMVDEMDLDESFAFYRERFASAGDFTFVFVGSFDPDTLRPLVERYLGGLPSAERTEGWKDTGIRPVPGVAERRVVKGIEPQSQAAIVFHGPMDYNQTERVAIRALAQVLQVRLRETLREELGGTYGASVGPGYMKIPRPEYRLSIGFGSSPDRTDALVTRVFEEIEKLKREGPTPQQVQDVKTGFLRELETNSQQNSYLLTNIVAKYWHDEVDELGTFFNLGAYYEKISAEMIQEAAREYLSTERYVKVTLYPEQRSTTP
jgi:zinc protease